MDSERAPKRVLVLRRRLPSTRRLRQPREFAAVISASPTASWTARGRWLAMKAAWRTLDSSDSEPKVRLGITIAKRWAKRSVDRSRLKRIVRESFRNVAAGLDAAAAAAGLAVDVSIRLVAPYPATLSAAEFKRVARGEADELLEPVRARLSRLAKHV